MLQLLTGARNAALIILALGFLVAACGDDDGEEPETATQQPVTEAGETVQATPSESPTDDIERAAVTFMAAFKPQANLPFVGVYVAQERGFFDREDLDVAIEHDAGGQGEAVRLLVAGAIEFSTADAAVVMQRRADPGLPLVAIAQVGQRGQQGFAVKADSAIETPADFAGRVVGYKGATVPPDLFAILDTEGLGASDIELVNIGFDPRVFVEGQVDVYPLFLSNEPFIIEGQLETPIRIFEAADYHIPTLGLTYVTNDDFAAENPDVVERFLRAVIDGINWAIENPEEALEIVAIHAPGEDPDLMRFMLETEIAVATEGAGAEGIGLFDEQRWSDLYDVLVRYEALTAEVDPQDAYNDTFIEEIHLAE
ncbi:MAG: hypothetical protein GEU28_07240 [Dehalococcoidia bacterium]|nr:hypothetical protein [Dehalococcoidia bacterium]